MTEARLDAPFGPVILSSPAGALGPVRAVDWTTPEGVAPDGGWTGEVEVAFGSGDEVEIALALDPVPGAEVRRDPDQWIEAWEVDLPGLVGHFGMNDAEWFEKAQALEVSSYAPSKAGIALRLRASAPAIVPIRFAAAWISLPDADAYADRWIASYNAVAAHLLD